MPSALCLIFKLAVHERWYTTKHENLTPTTPLHPYTPTPFFKLVVYLTSASFEFNQGLIDFTSKE
jgi:hypothetical protein